MVPPSPVTLSDLLAENRRRISVVGTTGAGKTTLAARLARRLAVPHIELDALHWGPGWTPAPVDVFRERVARAIAADGWVVDGNYSAAVGDLVWDRAQMVVWLDYALPVILMRLLKRTLRRVATRQELWNGNREEVRQALFSRDSLFVWAVTTHHRRRQTYQALLREPHPAHFAVVHLQSPRETNRWLTS